MKVDCAAISDALKTHKRDTTASAALIPLHLISLVNQQACVRSNIIRSEYNEFVKTIDKLANLRFGRDVHSYAAALISLLDPSAQESILKNLDFTVKIRTKYVPLDESLLSVIDVLTQWYAKNEYIPICGELLGNLIQKSEKDNAENIMRHRSLVTAALSILVDLDREKTIEICMQQERCFMRSSGAHAAQFYWYYAFSLYP